MAYLVSWLPVLLCPLSMGLMLWLMRGHHESAIDPHRTHAARPGRSLLVRFTGMLGMCINWRVVALLAAVGLSVWIIAPSLIWVALPLLLVAVCPLSMLLLLRGRRDYKLDEPRYGASGSNAAYQAMTRVQDEYARSTRRANNS